MNDKQAPLTDAEIEKIIGGIGFGEGWNGDQWDYFVARAVEYALLSRTAPPNILIGTYADKTGTFAGTSNAYALPAQPTATQADAPPPRATVDATVIVGALFDFMGMLTGQDEETHFSAHHDAAPAVDMLERFAAKRGLNLDCARVGDWYESVAPTAQATEPEDPIGLSAQLREYASNAGYSHGDYADTMTQAADAIDRLTAQPTAQADSSLIDLLLDIAADDTGYKDRIHYALENVRAEVAQATAEPLGRNAVLEEVAAHFDATHRELWCPEIVEEILAMKDSTAPVAQASAESLVGLRHAVRTACLTGFADFRNMYDKELLSLFGCETFQDLYEASLKTPTAQASAEPVAWYDAATGAFYLSLQSIPKDRVDIQKRVVALAPAASAAPVVSEDKRDAERLDWLIAQGGQGCVVEEGRTGFWLCWINAAETNGEYQRGEYPTGRAAIDAAIAAAAPKEPT